MKANKLNYIVTTAVFFLIGTMNVLADTMPPGPEGTPDPSPGEAAPIDQAMIWLLVAGIFAALYFLQAKKAAKAEK